MIRRIFLFLLALVAPGLSAPAATAAGDPQVSVVTIHERVVIRVPRAAVTYAEGRPVIVARRGWKDRKGPKCLSGGEIAAAAVSVPASVDLLLADGRRMRARLDRDCRSADFYSGLYLRPGADGRICADRDAIRIRSGAACEIEEFRELIPR